MNTDDGRTRARSRVADEITRQGIGTYELARNAGVDPATVSDFLAGRRWPLGASRAKIAEALGWPREGIDMLVRGEEPPSSAETVGAISQDDGVLLSLPPEALEGLGPAEREEIIAAAKYKALQVAREIRRRVDDEATQRD